MAAGADRIELVALPRGGFVEKSEELVLGVRVDDPCQVVPDGLEASADGRRRELCDFPERSAVDAAVRARDDGVVGALLLETPVAGARIERRAVAEETADGQPAELEKQAPLLLLLLLRRRRVSRMVKKAAAK